MAGSIAETDALDPAVENDMTADHFFTTTVSMTRSSFPVLMMVCSDPFGQMCITPAFSSSSTPSQMALPEPDRT